MLSALVPFQITKLTKSFIAHIAFIRFLVRVNTHVVFQSTRVTKTLLPTPSAHNPQSSSPYSLTVHGCNFDNAFPYNCDQVPTLPNWLPRGKLSDE